jgi:hypothetical protein
MAGRQGLSAARQSTKSIAARSRPDTPKREAAAIIVYAAGLTRKTFFCPFYAAHATGI